MSGTKNKHVADSVRGWIRASGLMQKEVAKRLGVTPAVLSQQLLAHESLPFARIVQIADILAIPKAKVDDVLLIAYTTSKEYFMLEEHAKQWTLKESRLYVCIEVRVK